MSGPRPTSPGQDRRSKDGANTHDDYDTGIYQQARSGERRVRRRLLAAPHRDRRAQAPARRDTLIRRLWRLWRFHHEMMRSMDDVEYRWRAALTDAEMVELVMAHGGRAQAGWWDQIRPHSLGWVTARRPDGLLVGFVNVAWDGGDHAVLLDTKVRSEYQRRGIATELVRLATSYSREAGCEWLHVDFEPHLAPFYFDACDFQPTLAGLIYLPEPEPDA